VLSSIIGTIIVGAIIGALGRLILPGKQNISILVTIVIGIVASLVGGIILGLTAYKNNNGGIPWISLIVGAILAAIGITVYGRMSHSKAWPPRNLITTGPATSAGPVVASYRLTCRVVVRPLRPTAPAVASGACARR